MAKKKGRLEFAEMKKNGEKVAWITAYDFPTAMFAEAAGMDMILVGDSLGMVVLGYSGTIHVTMDDCIYHCKAVRRGAPNTFVMGDMPFGSYQVSDAQAKKTPCVFSKRRKWTRLNWREASESRAASRPSPTAACWFAGTSG